MMKTVLRNLLTATMLGGSLVSSGGLALADGPYGEPTYQDPSLEQDPNGQYGQPGQPGQPDPNGQVYQPPPEGTCVDENNQPYDCSSDTDYASYGQLDDGYDPNAYQDFQSTLAPYGNWVSTEQYGQVWVPNADVVGADFTPYYSGGRWSNTDYGWTWVSDYSWGWAPFHYGRWHRIGTYGWSWIPGRIWGPAWVHWRLGGGYVGWTALPPRGVRIAPALYAGRSHFWNFVPMAQITAPRLVRIAPPLAIGLWGRTSIATDLRAIGSTRIVYGPGVHHFTGASIRITPAPLHTVQMAMPRANIVVRAGVPLQSRPYYAPVYRHNWGGGRTFSTPPGRPGWQPAPYQPAPGPRPGWPQPSYPRPGYQSPGYQPAPAPRPGFQPAPFQPAPAPRPGFQPAPFQPAPAPRPGYQPAPFQPAPAPRPAYQPPVYHQPAPSFQPAPAPRPVFQPAPRPAFQPAPSFQPAPAPRFQPPAPAPRPSYSPPSYSPPAYRPPTPSYQPPSRPSPPSYQAPRPSSPPSFNQAPTRSAPSFGAPPPRR